MGKGDGELRRFLSERRMASFRMIDKSEKYSEAARKTRKLADSSTDAIYKVICYYCCALMWNSYTHVALLMYLLLPLLSLLVQKWCIQCSYFHFQQVLPSPLQLP